MGRQRKPKKIPMGIKPDQSGPDQSGPVTLALVPVSKAGRPTEFRQEYCQHAFQLALLGATDAEMADSLRINLTTFYRWKNQFSSFADAISEGKLKADGSVAASLYQSAMAGSDTACIFWLKNRRPHEWKDKHDIEHSVAKILVSDI